MTPAARFQFLAVVLIWGTTWTVIRWQLGAVDPSWSVAYRFLIGATAVFAWCRLKGLPIGLDRSALPFLAGVGLFQFVLNFNFVYRAELYIPSGIPAVAFALLMVPNALLAWLFLKRRVTPRFVAGSALGIVGVGLLFAQQLEFPGDRSTTLLGLGLTVAAVLSASVANVMQASDQARRLPALAGLGWAMLVGAGLNAALALAVAGPPTWDPRPQYLAGLLFLGIMASAVAFAFYYDLIRTMGPAEAAWTGVLVPVIAMGLSTLLEGYRWTPTSVAGSVLAVIGMVVALRQPARRPALQGDG